MGTFFLERYKAIIDCKNNYLIIRDRKYDIYRSTQKGLEDKTTQVININHNDSPFCNLNYVNVYNKGELMGKFLIDSGAEGSVISEKIVPKHLNLNQYDAMFLKGIGKELIPTLGSVIINLFGYSNKFYVISRQCPMPSEGILGLDFLFGHGVTIDYNLRSLVLGTPKISFGRRTFNMNNQNSKPKMNIEDYDEEVDLAYQIELVQAAEDI